METSNNLKLNLIGLGEISSKIVDKMYDPEDCIKLSFPNDLMGDNLESNENYWNENSILNSSEGIAETYCFVDGAQGISGITLSLLKQFSSKPITIFYIKKEQDTVIEKTNHKICFNVLQEYARSGVFKSIFLFDYTYMWEKILESILNDNDDNEIEFNEMQNLVIDKIIFGAHIYWRLCNEKYVDGSSLNFDNTIYKINTFFEPKNYPIDEKNVFYTGFYPIKFSKLSTIICSLKEKINKNDLLNLASHKKIAKNTNSKLILLKENDLNFVISILSTNIVQESDYMKDYTE